MKKANKKVNAAIIIIGNEILSGRTQDVNVVTISIWLNELGVKLEEVRAALSEVKALGMTVTEVKGFGRQTGQTELYRATVYRNDFLPKTKIELAVKDEDADSVIEAISSVSNTGKVGDGKIFVYDLEKAVRIRTGETGEEAL